MCRAGKVAQSLQCLPPSEKTRVCSQEALRSKMARKVGTGDLPAPCRRSNLIGELQANDNETPRLKGDGPCS